MLSSSERPFQIPPSRLYFWSVSSPFLSLHLQPLVTMRALLTYLFLQALGFLKIWIMAVLLTCVHPTSKTTPGREEISTICAEWCILLVAHQHGRDLNVINYSRYSSCWTMILLGLSYPHKEREPNKRPNHRNRSLFWRIGGSCSY